MSNDAAEDLARLVAETERVARQVEDVRVRIAAGTKRRPGSEEISVEPATTSGETNHAASEPDKTHAPPSERVHCLTTVSKLLPSLNKPRRSPPESGVYMLPLEPGRYSIIAHRRERGSHVDLPMPVASKNKVSA
ncbi:MAG TPA: hypothetical protein VE093_25305 [Polyangiaceae bacterium]|jgi:hypothetical protein|nr:hypothetical protein [Polyangiaceae bacterium]